MIEDVYTAVFSFTGSDAVCYVLWEEYGYLMKEKVTERQRAVLERSIIVEKLEAALKEMFLGKSSRYDGVIKGYFSLF